MGNLFRTNPNEATDDQPGHLTQGAKNWVAQLVLLLSNSGLPSQSRHDAVETAVDDEVNPDARGVT